MDRVQEKQQKMFIAKLISFVNGADLDAFCSYLNTNNHTLSLKLVDKIREGIVTADDAAIEIYGTADTSARKKALQLGHQTLKLTAFLARTRPSYLYHGLLKIEQKELVGDGQKAYQLAKELLAVAGKVEDFGLQTRILQYLAQKEHLLENPRESAGYLDEIDKVEAMKSAYNAVFKHMRFNFNSTDKASLMDPDFMKHASFFEQFEAHEAQSVQILAKHGKLYTLSFLNDSSFFSEQTQVEIETLSKQVGKYPFLILPYAEDVLINIDYLMLKHFFYKKDQKEILKSARKLTGKWDNQRFWNGYYNFPETVGLSIQASVLLTKYLEGYKKAEDRQMPEPITVEVQELRNLAERSLNQAFWKDAFHLRYINLNNIYCCLLLLGNDHDIRKATSLLESLLTQYQQVSFQKLYDAIFATLIIGYFCQQDYDKVEDTFKRYEHLTAGQVKMEENDLTIKAFYYCGQWLKNGRTQYVKKFRETQSALAKSPILKSSYALADAVGDYFDMP